jgi:hypothetical protein
LSGKGVVDELKARVLNNVFGLGHDLLDYTNYLIQGDSAVIGTKAKDTITTDTTRTAGYDDRLRPRGAAQVDKPQQLKEASKEQTIGDIEMDSDSVRTFTKHPYPKNL